MEWLALVGGIACLLLVRAARRVRWKPLRIATRGMLSVLAVTLIITGAVFVWYNHRPLPSDTQEILFEGITYIRDVRETPRPLVIHVVTVDLDAPGIGFLVTPSQPYEDRQFRARTTSQFLDDFDVQIAINGSFFEPWWSKSIFDYYPHVGDPVDVMGFASSRGSIYAVARPHLPTAYFSEDNRVSFGEPIGDVYNALSGNTILLHNGEPDAQSSDEYLRALHPRTAIGLDESGRTFIIVVVDGRQPNYSEGVSLIELASMMQAYGAFDALNLDGGGSTALVMEGADGMPVQLDSPIDNRIPGRERSVANHLGIFASTS